MNTRITLGTEGASERLGRELNNLLGQYPDSELAKRIARMINVVHPKQQKASSQSVRPGSWTEAEIKLLGKKLDRVRREWTRDEEKLLGTLPDRDIAQMLQRHTSTVADRRRKLGIPRYIDKRREWTLEETGLLGKMPDDQLARRLQRTVSSVRNRRLRAGIPFQPGPNPRYRSWTAAEEALLGQLPDEEVAKRTGRTVLSVMFRQRVKADSKRDASSDESRPTRKIGC